MRRGLAAVVTAGLVTAAVLAVAGPASAHNQIVSTTPASGAASSGKVRATGTASMPAAAAATSPARAASR